ncbi:Uncharacterised protein [Mycobacteroides abscessus subsp. abscessus]|nr:Uncharacterised protein [Mycobacteroides abscessus subsp. abscessus]
MSSTRTVKPGMAPPMTLAAPVPGSIARCETCTVVSVMPYMFTRRGASG